MRVRLALLGVLVCVGVHPATGEVYRWTDSEGRLHFTENLDQVPREHRPQARESARPTTEPRSSSRFQTFDNATRAPSAAPFQARTIQIPFRRQGALMRVEARLNDTLRVPFFVDTGASGISLPANVAEQLGLLHGTNLRSTLVRTANGVVSRALVRLDSVEVAGARVEGLEATVNPSMGIGLLGGSFFNNFIYRVDAAESVITLRTNEGIRGGLGADQWRDRFRSIREPLARLTDYLENTEISREGRRAELEGQQARLERDLEELELEANKIGVPATWRE